MKRICLSFLLLLMACAEGYSTVDAPPDAGLPPNEVTVSDGSSGVRITMEPFGFVAFGPEGDVLSSKDGASDAVALIERVTTYTPAVLDGFDGFDRSEREDVSRVTARSARLLSHGDGYATVALSDPDAPGEEIRFAVTAAAGVIRIDLVRDITVSAVERTAAAIAFTAAPDEKFVGLGEREAGIDHRGKKLYCWTEEGGIGLGESQTPGPTNPFPNGEGMTHLPVPFFISSAGYGLWLDTTFRSDFDFDSAGNGTLRISADEPRLGISLAVSRDPTEIIRRFTRETGRATLPAPWVFGPRKRSGMDAVANGVSEIEALRNAGIPMTGIEDALHILPHGSQLGQEDAIRNWTADLHRLGYKGLAYLNPHISTERPGGAAYLAHAREHDALVKDAAGHEVLTKVVSAGLQEVVTIDFSSPAGTHFFEEVMAETLALGYDGWMLDFGEYLPHDALLQDGRTGTEAHNAFPLLVQQTARDYLDRVRPDDYLFFVRSGYTGTQSLTPMVWSGDPSASFEDARGLPAQVRSGVSAGLSGIPFWGSDATGFTCLSDPPADKEVYLRWMAFAALTPDMHEQSACAQRPAGTRKWNLWDDAETTATYAVFSGLHTRLFPYIYAAAQQAAASGLPIMRHALLMHPDVPDAWLPQEEYYFGPALYVAPVVTRGETERKFWLPPGDWFDWWTLAHSRGGRQVTRTVPLSEIPLYLRAGEIVPLLDRDVMTLARTDSPVVVDMYDRADVLDTRAAVTAAAPMAMTKLVDGTVLLTRLDGPAADIALPAGFTEAADDAQLQTCDRCGRIDGLPDGTVRLRATFQKGSTKFGGLTLGSTRDSAPLRVRWDVLAR